LIKNGLLFQTWFSLARYVATCKDGEPVKHAEAFTQEDVDNFLILADSKNRYCLVRKVVLIIGLAGKVIHPKYCIHFKKMI
jgi:hypothetical protein